MALSLALAGLAGFSCQPHVRPDGDPEAIAAWEDAQHDAGRDLTPTDVASESLPPSEVVPGELVDEATGTNLGTNLGCREDAGVCDGGGDVGPVCPGCLIAGECVGVATVDGENPCQVCDPDRDPAGWSANDGATCDDGLFCTTTDTCSGAVCTGQPRECDDGVACNGVSSCDEASASCSAASNECGANGLCDVATDTCVNTCDGCLIAGVCVPSGTEAPGNPCLVCSPLVSNSSLSPAAGKACGAAASACSQQDTCNGQGVCQPNHLPAGTPCGSANSSVCDQSDVCDGSGSCSQRLAPNGTVCDDGAFCTVGDQCQGGRCVQGGARSCGVNQSCNEQQDQCQCQGCTVGGTCFASGERNPTNACLICDPSRSRVAFSANVNATCGDGLVCGSDAQCRLPNGATCVSDADCGSARCDIWYRDRDGDGFGDPGTSARTCGSARESFPPVGFVGNDDDCCDRDGSSRAVAALMHPGQDQFFNAAQTACPQVGPFDYNCDAVETSDHFGPGIECPMLPVNQCESRRGWAGGPTSDRPACGVFAVAFSCTVSGTGCFLAPSSDRFDESLCQ